VHHVYLPPLSLSTFASPTHSHNASPPVPNQEFSTVRNVPRAAQKADSFAGENSPNRVEEVQFHPGDDIPTAPERLHKYWSEPVMSNLPNRPTAVTATITERTARWRSFTVQTLYEFLAEVADYEHAHRMRLNHIPMIALALMENLVAWTAGTMSLGAASS